MRKALPLVAALLAGCTQPAGNGLTNAQIATNFLRIALAAEYTTAADATPRLSKWTEAELGVYLEAPGLPAANRAALEAGLTGHLRRLQDLTGLRFRYPGSARAEGSHIILFVLPRPALDEELRATFGLDPKTIECFGGAFRGGDRPGVIRGALIGIPDDLPPEELHACLVEEITQAMGLFMDDDRVAPSIFNDDDQYRDLTWQDELLLRVLYDPRLVAGMTRAQAAPVVRRVLDELRPGTMFANTPTSSHPR